jgi:hypothetical protein
MKTQNNMKPVKTEHGHLVQLGGAIDLTTDRASKIGTTKVKRENKTLLGAIIDLT